jgi:hypothetical protein
MYVQSLLRFRANRPANSDCVEIGMLSRHSDSYYNGELPGMLAGR